MRGRGSKLLILLLAERELRQRKEQEAAPVDSLFFLLPSLSFLSILFSYRQVDAGARHAGLEHFLERLDVTARRAEGGDDCTWRLVVRKEGF